MRVQITVHSDASSDAGYLSWAPVPAQICLVEAGDATEPVAVTLANQDPDQGGQVVFWHQVADLPTDELQLDLPADGALVDFFVGGKFGAPSVADGDAGIEATTDDGTSLGVRNLMVRVRKNADTLTDDERDRFLSAFARLNDQGLGLFRDFRDMHTNDTSIEAHGRAGFLPWHRAYLLDLERELQAIDPSVALPYWRFDESAPNLFTTAYFGVADDFGRVQFDAANPLLLWTTDGEVGILRQPRFDTATQGAGREIFPGFFIPVLDEVGTLALGTGYGDFRAMEGDPHGAAHTSFAGSISSIPSAARDPLFFLLHANVDRMWAKWQWLNRRFDTGDVDAYSFLGSAGEPGATRVGHNLGDTMWPWNQIIDPPRPSTAPGGQFPASPAVSAPGVEPQVGDTIAFQGHFDPATRLGFDYDDVPFEA